MHRRIRIIASLVFALGLLAAVNPFAASVSAGTAYAAGAMQTYVVLYKESATPAGAAASVGRAGGTLVASYPAIGVLVARSDNAAFGANMRQDGRVAGAAATTGLGSELGDGAFDAATGDLPNIPATDNDNLSGLQWDMRQIKAPEAHAITGGSPAVLVGDLDTGLDFTHPDLAPNYDAANSADCSSGVATPLLPGNDKVGHGTHTAGTIAAAANGVGIVGVAPKVRLAGIKTSNDDGYFFPEMVVCAFMWVGSHGFDVVNNSYFADPWLYNCRNDPGQRAIWQAEQRAIRYAMSKGVTVVASAGNENQDLAHPTTDDISPDFPPGSEIEREITNACVRIPAEIPGVITVSANGNLLQKSYYSDYGIGVIDVVAPGGDAGFQLTPAAPNGRVLSTYPATVPCTRKVVDQGAVYCYLQGTSMAGPHVTGVAALVVSRYGRAGGPNGKLSPGQVGAIITSTADPQPCPPNPFNPGGTGAFLAICQGDPDHNGFYGHGQVNALRAITR